MPWFGVRAAGSSQLSLTCSAGAHSLTRFAVALASALVFLIFSRPCTIVSCACSVYIHGLAEQACVPALALLPSCFATSSGAKKILFIEGAQRFVRVVTPPVYMSSLPFNMDVFRCCTQAFCPLIVCAGLRPYQPNFLVHRFASDCCRPLLTHLSSKCLLSGMLQSFIMASDWCFILDWNDLP